MGKGRKHTNLFSVLWMMAFENGNKLVNFFDIIQ